MNSHFHRFALLFALLLLIPGCPSKKTEEPAKAPEAAKQEEAAKPAKGNYATPIDAVKSFYNSISEERFDISWDSLSAASKDKFIKMVAEDEKMDPVKVKDLFDNNRMPIRMGFWKSFRDSSKIATFASKAQYKLVSESGNEAVVEMNAEDVVLESKAIKEGSVWKMGYVESFLKDDPAK